jgi:predicted O-methyltransferase YrrM
MSIADDYKRLCETPSDIYEHLPLFVSLCETLDARTVIELGTRSGVSTVAWLHGLPEDGRLYSVDLDPAPTIDDERWTFIQGDDLSTEVVEQLPVADIVFIDTCHEYEWTLSELNLYRWCVRPGGRIVLHDTELMRPLGVVGPPYPVKRAVMEFTCAVGWNVRWHRNCWGLAIIEVPE